MPKESRIINNNGYTLTVCSSTKAVPCLTNLLALEWLEPPYIERLRACTPVIKRILPFSKLTGLDRCIYNSQLLDSL